MISDMSKDHARCQELAHPDIVNFGVSMYVVTVNSRHSTC
jgi:hypothetical protein